MATCLDQLLSTDSPDVTHTYTEKDAMPCGLGIGLRVDALDESQLHSFMRRACRCCQPCR
jgi:hypothetical protein